MDQPDLLLVSFPLFDPESAQAVAAGVVVRGVSQFRLHRNWIDQNLHYFLADWTVLRPCLHLSPHWLWSCFSSSFFCWDDSFCFFLEIHFNILVNNLALLCFHNRLFN